MLPSRQEGMSNALLEAQSWGIPCVVSDIIGNAAVVDHGINGLLFPVDDATKMAEAILELLSNDSLGIELGHNARIKAIQQFDLKQIAERMLNSYKAAITVGNVQ